MVGIRPEREISDGQLQLIWEMESMWLKAENVTNPECDVILNCHPGRLVRAEVDLSLTVSYLELSLAINHGLSIEDIDEFPYSEIAGEVRRDVTVHNLNYFTRSLVCVFGQSPPGYEEILFLKGKVGIGERRMVIGRCLAHRLATRFPLSIQETLTGAWKTVLGNGCGNCVCFHPEFAPLPEIMEETVAEAELEAFDEAWFAIQQTLTEEEARLRRQASLTWVDVGRALLKCKYSLWLQFWTPRLKKSRKNKRGRELERRRKAAEAEVEAAGGSVPSPGPKPLKQLFENEAVSTAAAGSSDLQRELDGVRGRSMARRSDRANRSKSTSHLMMAGGAAAATPALEGEAVWKVLFSDEAEVSRRREQRRRELIHQHENLRRPTPLMDLDVKVKSELNVKVRQEKRSKSLHRLTGRSETVKGSRTVHLIPAGAESTHRQQQQGARPKQIAVSIFPDRHHLNTKANDAANAAGAADDAANTAGTANAATFLRGVGRGLGNRFLLPHGYETMDWEEKQIWDERANTLMKKVLPQLAPGFRPKLQAWQKAPETWPHPGQTDEDILHDWLKFEKQARADEKFADAEPPARRPTIVQNYTQTLKERFRTCEWRIFLPDGFYGREEEDIPPWMQHWCQLLLKMVPGQLSPPRLCWEQSPLPRLCRERSPPQLLYQRNEPRWPVLLLGPRPSQKEASLSVLHLQSPSTRRPSSSQHGRRTFG